MATSEQGEDAAFQQEHKGVVDICQVKQEPVPVFEVKEEPVSPCMNDDEPSDLEAVLQPMEKVVLIEDGNEEFLQEPASDYDKEPAYKNGVDEAATNAVPPSPGSLKEALLSDWTVEGEEEEERLMDVMKTRFEQKFIQVKSTSILKRTRKSSLHSSFDSTDDVLSRKKMKQKDVPEVDRLMNSAMEGLEILQSHLSEPDEDTIDTFMHYIASELREIRNPANLMKAKRSIFHVVYDIRKQDLRGKK